MWRGSWTPRKWNRVKPCILSESLDLKKLMCFKIIRGYSSHKRFLVRPTLFNSGYIGCSCGILVLHMAHMARILQQFFLSRHWSSPIVWYTSTGQFLSRDSLRETRAWHFLFTCSEPTKIAKKSKKQRLRVVSNPQQEFPWRALWLQSNIISKLLTVNISPNSI